MSHALDSWSGRTSLLAACGLVVSCANIAGIDDLSFDLTGEGGGVTASGSTGAPSSSPSSTSTGDTTSDASSSSSSSASSGGEGGTGGDGSSSSAGGGGEGGEPPTGFVPACGRDDYSELLRKYGSAIWHLDEPEGETTADDDGDVREPDNTPIHYHATYLPEGGSLTHEVPGAFPDHTAVTFSGGARAVVEPDGPYYFSLYYEDSAFTLSFFFKRDPAPSPIPPVTVLSCFGASVEQDREHGWRVVVSDDVVLELVGDRMGGLLTVEPHPLVIPADGEWHFVLLAQAEGVVRGYVDAAQQFATDTNIVNYDRTLAWFSMGAAPGEAGSPAITLDEVAMSFEPMSVAQIDSIRDCVNGAGCFYVPNP